VHPLFTREITGNSDTVITLELANMIFVAVCIGVKVMFRVALVLFKFTLGRPEQLGECPTLYETMDRIRHIPQEYMQEEFLSREVRFL